MICDKIEIVRYIYKQTMAINILKTGEKKPKWLELRISFLYVIIYKVNNRKEINLMCAWVCVMLEYLKNKEAMNVSNLINKHTRHQTFIHILFIDDDDDGDDDNWDDRIQEKQSSSSSSRHKRKNCNHDCEKWCDECSGKHLLNNNNKHNTWTISKWNDIFVIRYMKRKKKLWPKVLINPPSTCILIIIIFIIINLIMVE